MTREDEILARLEKATPGPWRSDIAFLSAGVNDGSNPYWKPATIAHGECTWCPSFELLGTIRRHGANYHVHANLPENSTVVSSSELKTVIPDCDMNEADVDLIANAPTDLNYLLKENQRVRELIKSALEWLYEIRYRASDSELMNSDAVELAQKAIMSLSETLQPKEASE